MLYYISFDPPPLVTCKMASQMKMAGSNKWTLRWWRLDTNIQVRIFYTEQYFPVANQVYRKGDFLGSLPLFYAAKKMRLITRSKHSGLIIRNTPDWLFETLRIDYLKHSGLIIQSTPDWLFKTLRTDYSKHSGLIIQNTPDWLFETLRICNTRHIIINLFNSLL